ncbi:hypothetical protein [Frankia sp. CiP3]|uniref:hypothetical protein n=1 Tax=Frankia sp. CiP3 TaxID=2880971 RepID=UPI001EF453AC|nr:hypothetical protein [Frankia sp. CiP3]
MAQDNGLVFASTVGVGTPMERYGHVLPERLRAAATAMDGILAAEADPGAQHDKEHDDDTVEEQDDR